MKIFDHFICIDKAFFHEIGGFWEKAEKFIFMYLCLRPISKFERG